MIRETFSVDLEDNQIKALILLMNKENSLDCGLKPLYDMLLDYIYDSMTIEEAEQFFNEN